MKIYLENSKSLIIEFQNFNIRNEQHSKRKKQGEFEHLMSNCFQNIYNSLALRIKFTKFRKLSKFDNLLRHS